MYNHAAPIQGPWSKAIVERVVAENAAILTGIGIGTAFALLLLLTVIVVLVRLLSLRIFGVPGEATAGQSISAEAQARDKALAAVISVVALRSGSGSTGGPVSGDG